MEHYFEEIRNHDPVEPEESSDKDKRGDGLYKLTTLQLYNDTSVISFPLVPLQHQLRGKRFNRNTFS